MLFSPVVSPVSSSVEHRATSRSLHITNQINTRQLLALPWLYGWIVAILLPANVMLCINMRALGLAEEAGRPDGQIAETRPSTATLAARERGRLGR